MTLKKDKIEKYFDEYVSNYNMSDEDIKYKYFHSYRVMELSVFLAKELNLSYKDIYLAKLIGLYHDIGRFEQDKLFNTFEDQKTFDHADYGVEVINKEKILDILNIDKKDYDVIIKAIRNHNKLTIEDGLNERELLFCKLIRDADKIDILINIPTREKDFFIDNNDEVDEEVKKQFYNHQSVNNRLYDRNKVKNDNNVFYLAFVFDINFKASFKYISDHHIIDRFYNLFDNKEIIAEYYEHARAYVEEMK